MKTLPAFIAILFANICLAAAAPAEEMPPKIWIEVNIPATEMILYKEGAPVFVKRVAIGRGIYPTPPMEAAIKKIEWNPWWYPPDAAWAKNEKPTPPGPKNPLGLVKMPISNEILFHGTNAVSSVGQAASHGCMRMLNSDATEIAWYLQKNLSRKNDPKLRDLYRANNRTTYVVNLDTLVPVKIVYRPIVARNDAITFYPDHYGKLAGIKGKKIAIISELIRNGIISLDMVDDGKIGELATHWPPRAVEVSIKRLLRNSHLREWREGPVCN